MADPFYGEIRIFAFNFAPRDWAFCRGQQVQINQNPALYAIISTQFGGNGTTYFNLPNLQGQVLQGNPTMNNNPTNPSGIVTGTEAVTLTENQIPAHTHNAKVAFPSVAGYETAAPGNNATSLQIPPIQISNRQVTRAFIDTSGPNLLLNPETVQATGAGQPHENRQPYLALNFCICLSGIFPPFN